MVRDGDSHFLYGTGWRTVDPLRDLVMIGIQVRSRKEGRWNRKIEQKERMDEG